MCRHYPRFASRVGALAVTAGGSVANRAGRLGPATFEVPTVLCVNAEPVNPAIVPRYVRINDLAAYTGLTVRHLHDLTSDGAIPHARVGRVVLYDLTRIDEWLAGMGVPARRRK